VLQEREVERLGGRHAIALDLRVLATTNRRLQVEVHAARFREDLYYRLNVFPLLLAPLRERRDDILPLAMQRLAAQCPAGTRVPAVSADAAHRLLTYAWPGNVRELDNVMQRALVLLDGAVIGPEHLRFEPPAAGEPVNCAAVNDADGAIDSRQLSTALASAERELILEALRDGQSRRDAAEKLGISPRTLRHKLARLRASGYDMAVSP